MTQKLTAQRLKSLKRPTSGRIEIVDSEAKGLEFRPTPAGAASWSLSIFCNGKRRRFSVGEYPTMGLAEARQKAERLRMEVRDGRDPVEEQRRRREAVTVGSALDAYTKSHLVQLRDGKRREAQLRSALRTVIKRPLAEVTQADFQAAIDTKATTAPIAANRLQSALSHFAEWCHTRGYIDKVPKTQRVAREKPRERVLSLEEIGSIWRATDSLGPVWGPFVRFLLLTAQRRGDVAGMVWAEVTGKTWAIPGGRTKNGRPHVVHLTELAIEQLKMAAGNPAEQAQLSRLPTASVFTFAGGELKGFGRMKARLDRASGVVEWTLHDFRTAFASHCAGKGVSEGVADRVLNHAASASRASTVARTYQRNALLEQRAEALELWAKMVHEAAA